MTRRTANLNGARVAAGMALVVFQSAGVMGRLVWRGIAGWDSGARRVPMALCATRVARAGVAAGPAPQTPPARALPAPWRPGR